MKDIYHRILNENIMCTIPDPGNMHIAAAA